MTGWSIDRVVHFGPDDFVKDGLAHFGFHTRSGRYYAIAHQRHVLSLVDGDGELVWTVAPRPLLSGVPNIAAELEYPMYVDEFGDGSLVVSNFGNARLYQVDPERMTAKLLVDGRRLGLVDMGNCVVDAEGTVWVNEVRGCRVWRFDAAGRPIETIGDGIPGFQGEPVDFETARFGWIYDLRRGPDGSIYVLDSGNFAVRALDVATRRVSTIAGTGEPGGAADRENAREVTFGSDPAATFDGPISLSVDEAGNVYVGDRFNHVVRMFDREADLVTTIAGCPVADHERANDPLERDARRLNLPEISSMDYHDGCLFVPTDLAGGSGDLVVLRKAGQTA